MAEISRSSGRPEKDAAPEEEDAAGTLNREEETRGA